MNPTHENGTRSSSLVARETPATEVCIVVDGCPFVLPGGRVPRADALLEWRGRLFRVRGDLGSERRPVLDLEDAEVRR